MELVGGIGKWLELVLVLVIDVRFARIIIKRRARSAHLDP